MEPFIFTEKIEKLIKILQNDKEQNKELSCHTQKIIIGENKMDYHTEIQLKFKMNQKSNKFNIANERCIFFQFKLKDTLNEQQITEQYSTFTKLVKQIVTVSSMLSRDMKEMFKLYKPECHQGKSTFNLFIRLPQDLQQYWITFQDYLLQFFANISKEELVLVKIKTDGGIKNIFSTEGGCINPFYHILKNCKIEISSLLNKIVNEQTQSVLKEFITNDVEEKKQNDILMLLYNLMQSQIEVNMESFTESELELLGLFPFQFDQIQLDFQPAIISKIKTFFNTNFSGVMKVNLLNSHTMCQFKLDTQENLSLLFDILIKT